MTQKIQQTLLEIAERDQIQLLFACESGSRGWGFASPDSDFDIRFLYTHPREKYLTIDQLDEQYKLPITPDDLDIGGWELRKALRLVKGSNMSVFEWLQSPTIYMAAPNFQQELWAAVQPCFSPRAALHHYMGIAKNALETATQDGNINIKKCFYVLRPLLAAKWVAERGTVPPMNFHELRVLIEKNPINAILEELLERKNSAKEGEKIALIPEIQHFIEQQWLFCDEIAKKTPPKNHVSSEQLNVFFNKWLIGN
jgi:uncharacterized protein